MQKEAPSHSVPVVRGLFLQAAALRAHSPPNQPVDQRRDLLRRKITTVFVYNSFVYWYNGEGTRDMAHDEHMQAYTRLLAGCGDKFREGVDVTRDNAIMVDKLDQAHDYANWIVDLYNTLGCFFRRPDRSARLLRVALGRPNRWPPIKMIKSLGAEITGPRGELRKEVLPARRPASKNYLIEMA